VATYEQSWVDLIQVVAKFNPDTDLYYTVFSGVLCAHRKMAQAKKQVKIISWRILSEVTNTISLCH
jgi:capsule polysaccharide export protein KpsC/LpsZ